MSKTSELSTRQHIRSSVRDGIFTNLNIGLAESYFCPFLLALGIAEVTAGLAIVVAQFIGVLLQMLFIRAIGSRWGLRRRLLFFLGLQALAMVPLFLCGYLRLGSPALLVAILGLYWGSLLSLNPPWNKLMGHTVPRRLRLQFFSVRNQFAQLSVVAGLITAGLLLNSAKGSELPIFLGIFLAGLLLKGLSWIEVRYHHRDHGPHPEGPEEHVRFRDFLRGLSGSEQGKLIVFLFFFYVSVHSAAPYFTPFMLGHLKFSYLQFMAVTAVAYAGRILAFRVLQKRAKPRHIGLILTLGTAGVSTSPLLWAISQEFWWVLSIEFLSGCYWAGFELATILLYYQKIEDRHRTSVMSYVTFLNVTGMVTGSLIGAGLMKILPGEAPYLMLFGISTFLRLLVLVCLPQMKFEGRIPKLISFNRVFSARVPFGVLSRPVIGRIRKEKSEEK
jgi:hypothetical protein